MASSSTGQDSASKTGAVFLSYAREDSAAAKRIADALRGFGVEVWFDQNELRGGDAWDSKIRNQVRTCTLFVPVISATTQARGEGYFRREWKIAVERTQDMAEHIPFILPVVIDATPESAAFVPDQFRRVQWTSLPDGVPSPQFVEHVRRLLSEPGAVPAQGAAKAAPTRPAPAGRRSPLLVMAAVAAAAIAAALFFALRPSAKEPAAPAQAAPAAPKVDGKSIAVLPFENMSEDRENNAFFADGIHEDILTNLALVQELRVVSRTSVMQYRSTTKPIRQIGQELGVAYILEGSVRRAGNKVRVTGQLIRAATDEHIWAKAYDRDLTDIFTIQGELAQEIANALQAAISPETRKIIERKPTENLAAYDLWLKSRQISNSTRHTPASLKQQEELLLSAVDLDPKFAQAWGDLAVCHALYRFWNYDHTSARLAQAKAAIDNAVRLAPDLPEVIQNLGTYYYYAYRDYGHALEQYERLARLRPNDATVFSSLGLIQRRQGDWATSIPNSRKATQLDPANGSYSENLYSSLIRVRRYDEAAAEKRRQLVLDPGNLQRAYELATISFLSAGSTEESDRFFAALPPDKANSPRGLNIRRDWARTKGDYAEAVRIDRILPYFEEDGWPHYQQALFTAMDIIALKKDRHAADDVLTPFIAELHSRLELEPENAEFLEYLASMEAVMGNADDALMHMKKVIEQVPETRDSLDGPVHSYVMADVRAWNGDKDAAIKEIARLLRVPMEFLNVHGMSNDEFLFPLQGDPRLEALSKDPANNAQLF